MSAALGVNYFAEDLTVFKAPTSKQLILQKDTQTFTLNSLPLNFSTQ